MSEVILHEQTKKPETNLAVPEGTSHSMTFDKKESRAAVPADPHSSTDSFQVNTKSPDLNLMITPSVYDCPQGKIKHDDFLESGGSRFKYNSNREPLRKEATGGATRLAGLGIEVELTTSNEIENCRESTGLRSKSNAARGLGVGRSGSFVGSMQNLTYGRNAVMTPKSNFGHGALATQRCLQMSTGKFGKGAFSSSPAFADQSKAVMNLQE